MKHFTKIIAVVILLINAATAGAQPRKVIYDDNEITLPNDLQYDSISTTNVIQGQADENLIYIAWQTIKEVNTSHFELQRSENGKDFEPIETITASGISAITNSYATTDVKTGLCCERLYYRLKTVFVNGKETLTSPISLQLSVATSPLLYTMP